MLSHLINLIPEVSLLPSAYEVLGKVMYILVNVCLSTFGRGYLHPADGGGGVYPS